MRRAMLVAVVVAAVSMPSPAVGVAGFGDVAAGQFYTAAVQWMVDNDITTGTSETCFSPDDPVTRGQAAAFMWRMEGSPTGYPAHGFADVAASWQQGPVSWMLANEITTGTSATTYSPDDSLTRGQLAALLWRLAGNPGGSPTHSFVDVVSDWQQAAISWMSANQITTGTTATTFSPEATVTRGQLATFFHRYKGSPAVVIDPYTPMCGPIPPNPGDAADCDDFGSQAEAQAWFDTYYPHYGDIAGLDTDNDGLACEADQQQQPPPSNPGDSVNCSDFSTQAAAQAWFDTYYPHYGDVANLDADGNGLACESLP